MAGRRPTPTALSLVKGNPGKRPVNKREPKPASTGHKPPPHLTDTGRAAWRRLVQLLEGMGVMTDADELALERLCDTYCEIQKFRSQLTVEGETYTTTGTAGDKLIKAHPAQAMLADADRRFKSYLVEFGLTPAARSKVEVKRDGDESDPLQEFFG